KLMASMDFTCGLPVCGDFRDCPRAGSDRASRPKPTLAAARRLFLRSMMLLLHGDICQKYQDSRREGATPLKVHQKQNQRFLRLYVIAGLMPRAWPVEAYVGSQVGS